MRLHNTHALLDTGIYTEKKKKGELNMNGAYFH